MRALVSRKTNSNLGFRSERTRENRFELSKASFAHSDNWWNSLEDPEPLPGHDVDSSTNWPEGDVGCWFYLDASNTASV